MQLRSSTCSNRPLVAVVLLFFLETAGGLPLSASTPAASSSRWPNLLETARLLVSRWLNETTAIIAAGVIVGLAAASFALYGFDWKDYDQSPTDRLVDGGELDCGRSTKGNDV
ncbi:hypothetical protein diail_6340 [Diaporthe ilicicola]|nr:hypothetical protein diail_6340 [Diaporthe ilicicola]